MHTLRRLLIAMLVSDVAPRWGSSPLTAVASR